MKVSVLCAGHAQPHAGWVAIDELADLLVGYFDAELLSPRRLPPHWTSRLRRSAKPRYEPVQTPGGDVLVVVAHSPTDLDLIEAIPDCRRKFARIHAWVTDSYFTAGFGRATAQYDSITVTAHEDVAYPQERFGIRVHQLYQGADCLTWAPRRDHARDVDVIAFGRTPPSYHGQFARTFHAPDSPYLYLHSPLGNVTGPTVHLERGMLFKLLHRTRISLAFHLFVEPQGTRPRSMMVTSRWLESLLAGCIVAGKRPRSRMADDMLSWPGATVQLADDPADADSQLRILLQDEEALTEQRRSNVRHMLLHNDWRDRIVRLCEWFALPVPPALMEDRERLNGLARRFA
ncbi:MAG: glycosyltransferase [Burkholderiales bacterium]